MTECVEAGTLLYLGADRLARRRLKYNYVSRRRK